MPFSNSDSVASLNPVRVRALAISPADLASEILKNKKAKHTDDQTEAGPAEQRL